MFSLIWTKLLIKILFLCLSFHAARHSKISGENISQPESHSNPDSSKTAPVHLRFVDNEKGIDKDSFFCLSVCYYLFKRIHYF